MASSSDFKDELLKKLREVGWFAVVAVLRWLLERLVAGSDPEDGNGAEKKHK